MVEVSRLRKEALFDTLSGILSPIQDIRVAAEERIKALEVTEDLNANNCNSIVFDSSQEWASLVLYKLLTPHKRQQTVLSQALEAKAAIKQLIPQCLNESISKVRSSIAYAISAIAVWDWPDSWPELFPLLMQLLQSGETNSVHGAMRVLAEFCQEINDTQMPTVALNILPEMYKVFVETEKYSVRTRSRAVNIFCTCSSVIGYTATYNKDTLNTLLYPILPQFTEALVSSLVTSDIHISDAGLKKEVLKVLCVLIRIVPNKIASWLPQILPPVWSLLTECACVYVNTVVNHLEEPDELIDSDGEDLGFQSLIFNIFTFVSTLLEIKKFRPTLKQGMADLMYYIVLYMQITEDQVRQWTENPDQFVEDEDEETFSYSIRIAAHDLLLELTQEFGKESCVGLCNAISKHLQEATQRKQIENSNWWKIEEACMLSLGNTSFLFLKLFAKKEYVFDLSSFLNSIVLNGLNSNGSSPFHTGRCLWFSSKYIPDMSSELIQNLLQATVEGMRHDQPISIRIIAVRAVCGFCAHLQSSNPNLLAPFLPALADSLITMITQFSNAQEVLALVMETLNILIMVNIEFTHSMESKISPLTIAIFLRYSSDPVITSITQEIFKSLCQNELCVSPLQVRLLPTLISIINAPEDKVAGNHKTVALDILQTLVRNSPKPLSEALIHQAFPAVVHCVCNTEDNSVLQQGGECLRSYVSCDINGIMKWHDERGNCGLSYIVQVATQLLNPNASEFSAIFVGRLVSTLISKAGPAHLGENMDLLLKAVLSKMQRADTLTVVQSLESRWLSVYDRYSGPEGPSVRTAFDRKEKGESAALIEEVMKYLESLESLWGDFESGLGVTARLWSMYIDMMLILRRYIHADRAGLWQQHLQEVRNMLPYTIASGHSKYMSCLPFYLNEMQKLPETAPKVHEEFAAGKFTVHQTAGDFNGVWTDLAMAFIQRFNTLGSSTFGQLQERYRDKLLNMKPRHCTEVHFVGDQYDFELKSLKCDERQRRESNINLPEYVPADSMKIPDWKTLLSNPCNRTNMLSYLASSWSQEASWPAGFCLVLGVNAQATRVTQTEHIDVDELYCPNHEEADTRIFAHIASCDDNKVFVIQATDTDIIFLAMYHFPRLPNVVELWVEKNDLFLSIHDLVNELAKAVGKDVLALTDTLLISYILSGCDSVCYPFKRGKKRTVKVALEHVDKHSTLSNCIRHKSGPSAHDQVITEARSFFCDLYGNPGYLSLDKLRAHLFASRKLDLRSLPPTEDAFHFHVLRNRCQICLYKQASFSNPVFLPPEEYGRIVDGDRLIPVMKSKPSKPSAAKLKYCKCKKKPNCLRNCPCAKAANLIMVFALLINTEMMEAILEFLSSVPGPEGGSALCYVLTEWCSKQHQFFGSYVNKVSTYALCKILEHGIKTNDCRLTKIQVEGDEIFSNTRKTRSKSSQEPHQWLLIPVLVKIFKLIVNELNDIRNENMAKDDCNEEDEDEGWEDDEVESQGDIDNLFALASDYPGYDADPISDDEEDDPDAVTDYVYHVNLEDHLTKFLCKFVQQPFYNIFSEHLTDNEKSVLTTLPSNVA
ncbi:Importin-9 [Nymphon striatum]|nr:Importin-9 [Nymphon striatum]